ncbi:MAG: hypothetical protein IPO91_15595 [Chloroflexi bacterium]|nr:hypothetical protein [Chloroflexota bacterium]
MKTLRSLLYCSLIVALLLGAPLTAQDIVLTEFYAPFNGNLSAYYPAGFDRIFSHGDILISNDPSAMTWYATIPLNSGEVVIVLRDPVRITRELGMDIDAVADALSAATPMQERSVLTVHGQPAVRLVESDEQVHVVFDLGAGQVTYATLVTFAGERTDFEPLFFAILEQAAFVEPQVEPAPEPEPTNVRIDHQLRSPFNAHYDGSVSIPVSFDYPADWNIDEFFYEKSVYLSNAPFSDEQIGAENMLVMVQVFPQPIADVPHFRDLILARYWEHNGYFQETTLFSQAGVTGVYGVLTGPDARDFELNYYLNADLVFENGLVYVEAYGGWARDYDEDETIIFDLIKSVRILD